MADPHDDALGDADVDPIIRAHAEELANDPIGEMPDGTKRKSIREWMRPTLGAVLLLVAAAGLAYMVIRGYRHASADVFVSVQDQHKQPSASAANSPVEAPTVSAVAPAPPQSAASVAPTAPIAAAPIAAAPIAAAPTVAPGEDLKTASSAAADADLPEEAQDNAACAAIKTEQHEIDAALSKQHSPEEGRYMQRRLRELAEQTIKRKCGT
jgi:hypothetical protein